MTTCNNTHTHTHTLLHLCDTQMVIKIEVCDILRLHVYKSNIIHSSFHAADMVHPVTLTEWTRFKLDINRRLKLEN